MEFARMGVVLSPGKKPGDNDSFNPHTSYSRDRKLSGDLLSLWKCDGAYAVMEQCAWLVS